MIAPSVIFQPYIPWPATLDKPAYVIIRPGYGVMLHGLFDGKAIWTDQHFSIPDENSPTIGIFTLREGIIILHHLLNSGTFVTVNGIDDFRPVYVGDAQ